MRPPAGELRQSALAGALELLARHGRLRAAAVRLALRLEGGPFYSRTARVLLERYYGVRIGAYSYGPCFRPGAFPPGLVVGRYVSMAEGVRHAHRNHPIERLSMHPFFYNAKLGYVSEDNIPSSTLEIGHDAWIGADAFITSRCRRIGIGAVVAACSVVTRDVDDFAIVGGNPARLIRYRFEPGTIERILASRWWEWPVEACVRHLPAMTTPLVDAAQHPLLRGAAGAQRETAACD